MILRIAYLIPYPIVFLSVRECFPIKIRQWCRNHIGVFPPGLNPDGFPCFKFALFGLQLYRDGDHDFPFFNSRKAFETQIWDPGDSTYKTEIGGIRPWIGHICGNLFSFVMERLSLGPREMLKFPQSDQSSPDETYVSDLSASNRRPEQLNLIRLFRRETSYTTTGFLPSLINVHSFGMCLQPNLHSSHLRSGDPLRIWNLGVNDGNSMVSLMELWLVKFRFCWTAMAQLHVVLADHWQPYLLVFVQICWLENTLTMFRRSFVDKRESNIWNAMETFFVFMLKGISESTFLGKTLVRKCWCHYVYLSELVLDTSALMLRFVKRSHSHKLLFTIRNKEKSNMKLDNNRFLDRLASKATLRKASSNSLLLYFLLVYGTYICVCNNCASIILYVFVITFFE